MEREFSWLCLVRASWNQTGGSPGTDAVLSGSLHGNRPEQGESFVLTAAGIPVTEQMPDGTDIRAVQERYIAIGKLRNMVLGA